MAGVCGSTAGAPVWQHLVRRASATRRGGREVVSVAASSGRAPQKPNGLEHPLPPPSHRHHRPSSTLGCLPSSTSQHPALLLRAPLGCARFSTAPLSSSAAAPPVSKDSTSIDHGSTASSEDHRLPPPLSLSPSSVADFVERLRHAATWKPAPQNHPNQQQPPQRLRGSERGRQLWDAPTCRALSEQYDQHLRQLLLLQQHQQQPKSHLQTSPGNDNNISNHNHSEDPSPTSAASLLLLSSDTVVLALKVLLKSQPIDLAYRLRDWERMLGQLQWTPLTDHLTLRLLTANAKAGQVGRVLSLLRLRRDHQYRPRQREFEFALHAIVTAQQTRHRNPYLPDAAHNTSHALSVALSGGGSSSNSSSARSGTGTGLSSSRSTIVGTTLDNPTRWLDAILVNLHERNVPLTTALVARMLRCYAGGYTGKAVHHFYRVVRRPVVGAVAASDETDEADEYDPDPEDELHYQGMPRQYFFRDGAYREYPVQVHLEYHRQAPPFYKIPSQVGHQVLSFRNRDGLTKLQHESDPRFSPSLAAAFAFADSIQLGAAGHPSVALDTDCYNSLLLTCVRRGALWRALQVLDTMEQQQQGRNDDDPTTSSCRPNTTSYNLVLSGLARVGDVSTMQDVTTRLLSAGLTPDAYTVRAIVDGLLNLADMPGAITVVQDSFNQHGVLPPYTTHLKIFELCLARELVYEAKRHLYFVQQLWKWQPTPYHTPAVIKRVRATQRNTQLQRPALEALFAYFGERLRDSDFFLN